MVRQAREEELMKAFHASGMIVVAVLLFSAFSPISASAQEIDCLMCHGDLAGKKIKHAAVDMGCPSCHSAVDAGDVPHKMKNKIGKGLSAQQPELCYGCHDKSLFEGKNIHPAVSMGCTGCHNPHSSDNPKLLVSAAPDLCFTCHDKAAFGKKNVHPPVAAGDCLFCHGPHASDKVALLKKEPLETCLECHADVEKGPHAIKGFSNAGHPIGRKDKIDPKRTDRKFYCGSCHSPHSSDSIKLFRYDVRIKMGLCVNCHTY